MVGVQKTTWFEAWFRNLRDAKAAGKISDRIRRMSAGNFGDVASVGSGVSEMRIHHGPGYRVYFTRRGLDLVVLLAGGDKGSQAKDIRLAIQIAERLR